MSDNFNDKHLLWWVLQAIIAGGPDGLNQLELTDPAMWERLNAPDWVLPTLEEKLQDVP